jgi:hypothetical protein
MTTPEDTKRCAHCGGEFYRRIGLSRRRFTAQQFCSDRCSRESRVRAEHDTKTCENPACLAKFDRPIGQSRHDFSFRRFCSPACSRATRPRPANPIEPLTGPAVGDWRTKAVCIGADPVWFDAQTVWDSDTELLATMAAKSFCARCPVLNDCARDADAHRDLGVRGGVYRTQKQGRYWWKRCMPDAPEPRLHDRRRVA